MKERGIVAVKRVLVVMLALGAAFLARLIGFVDAQEPLSGARRLRQQAPIQRILSPPFLNLQLFRQKKSFFPAKLPLILKTRISTTCSR